MGICLLDTYLGGQGRAFFCTKLLNHIVVMSVWCPRDRDVKLHLNSLLGETWHECFHLSVELGQVCIKTWEWDILAGLTAETQHVPQVLGIRTGFKPSCKSGLSWVYFFPWQKYRRAVKYEFCSSDKLPLMKRTKSNIQRHYRISQLSVMGLYI